MTVTRAHGRCSVRRLWAPYQPLFGHKITQISVPLSMTVLIQYKHCRSICSCIVLDEINFFMVL